MHEVAEIVNARQVVDGRGRPKKREIDKRKHPVSCRLTDHELNLIDINRGGMSRGEFLRRSGMDLELPASVPAINKEAWAILNKVGVNVNQLLRQFNKFGAINNPNDVPKLIADLRLAVLGVKASIEEKNREKVVAISTMHDLHQTLYSLGVDEADFYRLEEEVLLELGRWCHWATQAIENVRNCSCMPKEFLDSDSGFTDDRGDK